MCREDWGSRILLLATETLKGARLRSWEHFLLGAVSATILLPAFPIHSSIEVGKRGCGAPDTQTNIVLLK
jgi:hypothetical protein